METAPIGDRLFMRLLGEQVGIVVSSLESHQGTYHRSPVSARRERGERSCALDVAALAQGVDSQPSEHGIGNLLSAALPMTDPASSARKDR